MKDIFALLKQGSMSALTAAIVNFILAGLKLKVSPFYLQQTSRCSLK